MSQETLGANIGVTFQQVQKYEKGTNRIGSSRLHLIATALQTTIPSLFGENETDSDREYSVIAGESGVPTMSKDNVVLNKAFMKIKDASVRKSVLDLVTALGDR